MIISEVGQWVVEGVPRSEITQRAADRWGYKQRNVDDLIAKARQNWAEELNKIDRKEFISEVMKKFDHLYEKGLTQKQLAVSHAALTAQVKLLHLD